MASIDLDTMEEDDLLSETDEAAEGLRRLIASGDVDMARPIPIPSHKRSPVVKYEEGRRNVHINVYTNALVELIRCHYILLLSMHEEAFAKVSEKRHFYRIYSLVHESYEGENLARLLAAAKSFVCPLLHPLSLIHISELLIQLCTAAPLQSNFHVRIEITLIYLAPLIKLFIWLATS